MMKITFKNKDLNIVVEAENTEDCVNVINNSIITLLREETIVRTVHEEVEPTCKDSFKPSTKKLGFFYCPNCNITFAKMIDLETKEAVTCHNCNTNINYDVDKLVKGTYKCGCGTTGNFLMHPDVTHVRCKDCGKRIYMVLNDITNEYEGKLF